MLASVGSLLDPAPLALALLPLEASAAGAAVVRREPVFLTREARWVRHLGCERQGLAVGSSSKTRTNMRGMEVAG